MSDGVVIAGGYATRFEGGDKAIADLAGVPMIRRVADRLAEVVDRLVVNCRDEQVAAIEEALAGYDHPVAFATDPEPDRGPIAGIATGLRAAENEYAVVVACDMPLVAPAFVAYLFERAANHDAAVPRVEEWFQPTQAVYHADRMATACDDALSGDDHRIVAALERIEYVVVEGDELEEHAPEETFRNVNTREELAAVADEYF